MSRAWRRPGQEAELAVAHVAIGVVLGAVATIFGTLLSRPGGIDLEDAFAWAVPAVHASSAAPPARLAEDRPGRQTGLEHDPEPARPGPAVVPGSFFARLLAPPPTGMPHVGPPSWGRGVHATTSHVGAAPTPTSPADDLALMSRGARIAAASPGWGGGARPVELVDGLRRYDDWAHGLAFGGGPARWNGEACGERFVEVELAEPARVDRVVVWHHGRVHRPAYERTRIEVLDGDAYRRLTPRSTTSVHEAETDGWWTDSSTPVEHRFDPVTTRRVRYVVDNCEIEHGWLYEIEVFAAAPVSPAAG